MAGACPSVFAGMQAVVFTAMGPLGCVAGLGLHARFGKLFGGALDGALIALTAGTFVYVGATEVVPEEFEDGGASRAKVLALLLGVATILGLLIALSWPVGLAACATWLVAAFAFRYSSLAALLAAGLAPAWALLLGEGRIVLLTIVLAAILYARHAANIARLRAGTEPRIGAK